MPLPLQLFLFDLFRLTAFGLDASAMSIDCCDKFRSISEILRESGIVLRDLIGLSWTLSPVAFDNARERVLFDITSKLKVCERGSPPSEVWVKSFPGCYFQLFWDSADLVY